MKFVEMKKYDVEELGENIFILRGAEINKLLKRTKHISRSTLNFLVVPLTLKILTRVEKNVTSWKCCEGFGRPLRAF